MTIVKKILGVVAAMTVAMGMTAQTKIGYATSTLKPRDTVTRYGSTEKQGMAMRLSKEKLQTLKGCKITAIETVFGSRNIVNSDGVAAAADVFVTTDLNGEAASAQVYKVSKSASLVTVELDTPYEITGDEPELYIGYTASATTNTQALSADGAADTRGCSYAWIDGRWADTFGQGTGNANIRIVLDKTLSFTDLQMKTFSLTEFYKVGSEFVAGTEFYNYGTEKINSFDVVVEVEGDSPKTYSYSDMNLEQGQAVQIDAIRYAAIAAGKVGMKVAVKNINGGEDADATDNEVSNQVMFYPEDTEKTILVEGFTGMMCSNCPSGHRLLGEVLEETDAQVVEVMHHSGYSPDFWSSDADYDYTFLYGSSSTYAPAVMFSRTAIPGVGAVPVIQMNDSKTNLEKAIAYCLRQQPYVALSLDAQYDEQSREVSLSFDAYALNDLPEGTNLFNVWLVQDKMIGYQTNASNNYEHNGILRRVLSGNNWGIAIPQLKAGENFQWTATYALPETLMSDFYTPENLKATGFSEAQVTMATDPENMRIVAYVGSFDATDFSGHAVYNCVEAKLGESYTQNGHVNGVETLEASSPSRTFIYNISGKLMPSAAELPAGMYVVKTVKGKSVSTKKIMVR